MSAEPQSAEQTVVESLASYSPEAMRAAIEAARDPEVAAALSRGLEELIENDPFEDFSAIGLCVVLGEARAEAAIPVLLNAVTRDDRDLETLAEAPKYALRRMGLVAFENVMRFIASEPAHWPKVAAYDILCAAATCDEEVRRRIGDFCVARAPLEMNRQWEEGEWHPGHSVCEVLLWLRDPRLEPLLKETLGRTQDPQYAAMLEEFEQVDEPDVAHADWCIDWPDQCRDWAESAGAQPFDEDSSADLVDAYHDLLEEFANSQFARALSCEPGDAAGRMRTFVDLATTHIDEDFSFNNLLDVREALFELLPRKVSAGAEYFEEFPEVFEAFTRFMQASGRLNDLQPLLNLAEEARTELPRLAADPRNWGIAKRLLMHGGLSDLPTLPAKCDLDSIVRKMAKTMDVDLDAELREQAPVGVEPTMPIRRETPKVGRNDPCPCGSGKKLKKCCGR